MRNEDRRITENREKYLGKYFESKRYGKYLVVEYKNSREVTVQFSDNSKGTFKGTDVIRGSVKNRNQKTVFGKGSIGFGKHKLNSPMGKKWESMMLRCYCDTYQERQSTYIGCEVDESWLNLQEFCESIEGIFVDGFELDKDLLNVGNKVYSKQNCTFIPREINSTLRVNRVSSSELPIGVQKTVFGRFCGKTSFRGEDSFSKNYKTPKEAFLWYKNFKENLVKSLAEKWKGKIEDRAYQALHNLEMTEKGWLTKEDSAFKFYETGEVEIPKYYENNIHLVGVEYE